MVCRTLNLVIQYRTCDYQNSNVERVSRCFVEETPMDIATCLTVKMSLNSDKKKQYYIEVRILFRLQTITQKNISEHPWKEETELEVGFLNATFKFSFSTINDWWSTISTYDICFVIMCPQNNQLYAVVANLVHIRQKRREYNNKINNWLSQYEGLFKHMFMRCIFVQIWAHKPHSQ